MIFSPPFCEAKWGRQEGGLALLPPSDSIFIFIPQIVGIVIVEI